MPLSCHCFPATLLPFQSQLKDQIQNDTNIVPGEQMLIVASTHVEPEGSHLLGDVAGNDHLLIVHLLTPNSAA
eukprot:m.166640 g.166640  ORF g.166640 m.166640 type:complete len:73 (+) comp16438_c0_seq4:140-358(+)